MSQTKMRIAGSFSKRLISSGKENGSRRNSVKRGMDIIARVMEMRMTMNSGLVEPCFIVMENNNAVKKIITMYRMACPGFMNKGCGFAKSKRLKKTRGRDNSAIDVKVTVYVNGRSLIINEITRAAANQVNNCNVSENFNNLTLL